MRKKQNWYLFAAALVAGTVGMSSCSNEEIAENPADGATTKIAVGMSLNLPVQKKAATTETDVNFGTGVADINNVTIVPMVVGAVQNPIVLGNFDEDVNDTHYKEATVLQAVDGFRVYGNLPSAPSEAAVFTMPSLAKGNNSDNGDASVSNLKEPHSLYYYVESTTTTNKFQVATGTTPDDWESVQFTDATGAIGANNRIKIPGVTYAVGVFSAAVLDEVEDVDGNAAFTKDIFSTDGGTPDASWEDLKSANGINITGLIIDGQSADFDAEFNPINGEVKVFAAAKTETLAGQAISFDSSSKVSGANIYTVVAPEDAQTVTINFQFQNNTGKVLHLNNGTTVANSGYFYLPAILDKPADGNIFAAATSTLINARVKDWGKGVTTPAETVDVEIGIAIDTDWAKGVAYDEEI